MQRMFAWLQLLRLPNLFTAAADILAGFFFANRSIDIRGYEASLGLAIAASVLLYAAGVVLNDVFDAPQDLRERPGRPIPSGRVRWGHAAAVGALLLLAGWLLTYFVGQQASPHGDRTTGILGTIIAASILLYDGGLKRTIVGPFFMGLCRGANVSLGMAAAAFTLDNIPARGIGMLVAFTWFFYTSSLTRFAAGEAGKSPRGMLIVGLVGMWLAPAALIPLHEKVAGVYMADRYPLFIGGLVLICILVGVPGVRAIATRAPADVQRTVKVGIFCLVLMGAVLAFSVTGWAGAAIVASLLVPTVALSRWVSPT